MMKRRNVRTLSLIIVTFTYLLIGAAVFDALEGPNNSKVFDALQNIKGEFIRKYNVSHDDYRIMELLVMEKKSHKSGPQWKFAGSFYYALVVLTLIGYGHSTPSTNFGKAFTMGYAVMGIPMVLVMFQSMGERMNKCYSVIIKKIRRWRGCMRVEATDFDLIIASGITSNIVIIMGAVFYHTQERWSFFDSLYYTFITLSTIGFGDFVALQSENQALQFRPGYVVCSFIFLLVGLAALSSSINLLVLRFMILSLEEDEDNGDDLHDGAANVMTLDGEMLAVNGRGGIISIADQLSATSERNICQAASASKDNASVCSCTCTGYTSRRHGDSSSNLGLGGRLLWCVGNALGCRESITELDEENVFDAETQSISNSARLAVKRASF